MEYVDWKAICRNKLQKYNLLKFIAVNDFGSDYKYVKTLKYNELCSLLEKESERLRKTPLEIGEEAIEIIPALLYQPGSVCANPDSVNKNYLAFIAGRMGVRKSLPKDLSGISNDQIC